MNFIVIFQSFRTPHIRSNGFIVRRTDFLREFPSIERGKHEAHLFESGPLSLTARILASGKSAVVVGRDGRAYPPHEWPMMFSAMRRETARFAGVIIRSPARWLQIAVRLGRT